MSPGPMPGGNLWAMQHVVIYAFRSPGSGAVYVGKHEPKVDPTLWPRRGHGRLPDRYRGSGVVVDHFHARHGEAVQWRILAIVPVADWPRAERRAIHLARLIFGRRCVNRRRGGDGLSSQESKALWSDPGMRARQSAATKEALNRPEVKARHRAGTKVAANRPEVKAQQSEVQKALAQTPAGKARYALLHAIAASPEVAEKRRAALSRPDVKARQSAIQKANAQTPERKAQLDRAAQIGQRKRRARRALAPFAVPPSIPAPGVCLWAYLPTLRLSIAGPKEPARKR